MSLDVLREDFAMSVRNDLALIGRLTADSPHDGTENGFHGFLNGRKTDEEVCMNNKSNILKCLSMSHE